MIEGEFVVRKQAGDQAEADALAMDFGFGPVRGVAAPVALVALHHVQSHRGAVAQFLVEVAGHFAVIVDADAAGDPAAVAEQRRLGDLVDYAASLAASEQHGGRATQYVDLLEVEGLAVVLCGVADAVEIHVSEGVEAAQVHVVARAAAFRSVER